MGHNGARPPPDVISAPCGLCAWCTWQDCVLILKFVQISTEVIFLFSDLSSEQWALARAGSWIRKLYKEHVEKNKWKPYRVLKKEE